MFFQKETVKYIQVPTLYPMGVLTFGIACSVCKNRNSSLCTDCKCEKKIRILICRILQSQ